MDVINKIVEGLHLDNGEYDQPVNTIRDNRNGLIYDSVTGNYTWRNLKGTTSILSLSDNDIIMKECRIRERVFLLVLNMSSDYVQLRELLFNSDGTISSTVVRWQATNTAIGMDPNHPVTAIFGLYESETIQRIYWSDNYNQPRCVNISNSVLVTVLPKFVNFFPVVSNTYGEFKFLGEISGNLMAGTYFFAWRFYKEGYYTDWSYISNPVSVFKNSVGSTYTDYQNVEGDKPDVPTTKGISFSLSSIDSDYDIIQVATFYTDDYNSVKQARIIFETKINATTMTFNYTGSEMVDLVTVSELMLASIRIEATKDMCQADKYNVIANITEREELDVSSLHSQGKNNEMEVQIYPKQYAILLDTRPYYTGFTPTTQPLYGTLVASQEINVYKLFSNMYHYAVTNIQYTDSDLVVHNITAGKYFKCSASPTSITGTAKLALVIKKYRKASGSIPYDLNNDYSLDASTIENEYYNYKNEKIVNKLKGYPSGEKIRLGILFLDKTGRPFFVRHLYNTITTDTDGLTIGPGDASIPERYTWVSTNLKWPLTILDRDDTVFYNGHYVKKNVMGMVNYLSVSGIDITPIKDQIGSFMIVRCPIERQNIGTTALAFTYLSTNDVQVNHSFRNYLNDAGQYPGCYVVYCPEDLLGLTGFSIQPGDEIINKYYMRPYYPDETADPAFQGYGELITNDYGAKVNLQQKFFDGEGDNGTTTNSIRGASHKILFYTKYRQGDGDNVSIDPRDGTKLLRYKLDSISEGGGVTGYSYITNLGIAILDIDESGHNAKTMFNINSANPRILVGAIKREIASPYGGLSDSSLAGSTYLSTGHFQEINDTVLNDIKTVDNKYIFNEVEVFGGDTFICIWDLLRCMINEDLDGSDAKFSHSILLPVETRINLDLRSGNRVGKLRTYHSLGPANGLRWKTGFDKWEDFNYNDGYSSDNINDLYLPVPINFTLQNKFDDEFRYSNPKTYGEYEDSFRKFNALDKITVDSKFGPVNNIRYKFRNIIYWQKNGIGYIPMGERALASTNIGNVIQLGVGGIFERFDETIQMIGNSNQMGLVETNEGFYWYDAVRKAIFYLDGSMRITPDSLIKGVDSYLVTSIPDDIDNLDNPAYTYGICGGFDTKDKMVYISFRHSTFNDTIGISTKANKFTGYFDFKSRQFFDFRNYLYSVINNYKEIHQHGTGTIGSYHGTIKDRYFTIIVRDNNSAPKMFDNWELIGNDKFFTKINFKLEDGTNIDEYYSGTNASHVSQKIKYRNRRWYGSFARLMSRERLTGGYVKLTFVDSGSDELWFNELKSTYRNAP